MVKFYSVLCVTFWLKLKLKSSSTFGADIVQLYLKHLNSSGFCRSANTKQICKYKVILVPPSDLIIFVSKVQIISIIFDGAL